MPTQPFAMTSIASKFLAVDPHLKNALSPTVKFDISHKSDGSSTPGQCRRADIQEAAEVVMAKHKPKEWELDVRALTSSRRWLQNYGLKKNRLQLNQILPSIGFKLSDDFDETLKKPVSSRYGGGLFRHLMRADGRTFNISCSKDKLLQLEKRLLQAVYLFRRRLDWLTTESRRLFGVIEERSVTIILDIRNMSPQQFDQYRTALERVLREQVAQLSKFNLIRASEDIQLYSPECVPISHDTLENAIQWMWNLDRLAPVSNTATAEAVFTALMDQHNEAIYLFTEGSSIESGQEVLKEKVSTSRSKIPINVVSFNCDSSETIKFLKYFASLTGGKFHAYAVVMELDAYEAQSTDGVASKANIMLRRKTFGGIPPGAGVREDVVLVFEEMEEARNSLSQVRLLIENAPEPKRASQDGTVELVRSTSTKNEQYMTSQEWLQIYGLNSKRLGLYDILSGVAFKHLDGVVNIMQHPGSDKQTDAVVQQKLVNARYCERFPVVRWKDGRVVHVQVTPEVHRSYEEKVLVTVSKIRQRIDWLNKGSRALFGTLVEDQIYILIDSSASLQPSLGFVKQKLFVLMQEQLRHKKKFNFVTFNSKAVSWKDRLVEVSERSLQSAWSWIQNLSCWGSTNTYGAIQMAMSDPQTEAIYLLTDGRPDQPPKSIIAQVQMQKTIPIHTISFNCNDSEANQFLFDLSEATGGRFHMYSDSGPPSGQPEAWESMDIKLLKDEIRTGMDNLDKLADLRDECTSLAWKRETESLRQSIESARELKSAMPPLEPKDLYRPNSPARPLSSASIPSRPSSAPPPDLGDISLTSPRSAREPTPPYEPRPSSAQGTRSQSRLPQTLPKRPKSAKVSVRRKPMIAGHTKTSLLRTLGSSGRFSPNEWLLPETKQLFQIQAERQQSLAKKNEMKEQFRSKRTKKLCNANQMSSKQWLAKHGLVAQRLTILDALGSTFIPHKAKYISILDKRVMSKVFDDILPIAHVSRNQQVRLVNPNGVNLKEYENKVKVALEKFRKRLNKIVWEALPQHAREEFDSEGPVSFEEHKEEILSQLEKEDWPVKLHDITLLTNEIARGEKFLLQSQALQKAAGGETDSSGEENSTYDLPPASDSLQRSKSYDSDSDHEPSEKEEKEDEKEDEKENEGIGQVIRSVDKTSIGKVKETSDTIKSKVRIKLDTLKGTKVIARRDEDGLYYPAAVVKCPDSRHALVKYDNGHEADIQTRHLIPVGGAVARPPLSVGDYILMRVVHLETKEECYVPAIIQIGPRNMEAQSKFYSVVMYNGQKASTLRTYLVKISKERFELASMYIADQQKENREKTEDLVYVSSPRWSDRKRPSSRARQQLAESVQDKNDDSQKSAPLSNRSRSMEVPYDDKSDDGSEQSIKSEILEGLDEDKSDNGTPRSNRSARSVSLQSEEVSPREEKEHSPRPASAKQVELERLKQKLLEQQKYQEHQKKKLKRKAKSLHKREKEMKKSAYKDLFQDESLNGGIVVPGSEDVKEENLRSPKLLHLRKSLQHVTTGEEVLARWSDDGWYYRGIVRQYNGDCSYNLEDSTGFVERTWREDIISENDNLGEVFEIDNKVIALHPHYSFSYAPGFVTYINDSELGVEFYDGETSVVPWSEVYHLSQDKYDHDVAYILKRETELIGAAVVAKDDKTGGYYPGTVKRKPDATRDYVISWSDRTESVQSAIHIFSAFTRRPHLTIGDRVLAMADSVHVLFLPGYIIGVQQEKLIIKFCDGAIREDVDPALCYWLGQQYYDAAVTYYKDHDPSFYK